MTTRTVSTFVTASLLSLTILTMANCSDDTTNTSTTLGTSSSSTSSSSSGEGGAGGTGGTAGAGGGSTTCTSDTDCKKPGEVCEGGKCIQSGCLNMVKDGTETDVDCGGADCLPCANAKACTVAGDCTSMHCDVTGGTPGMCAACAMESDCTEATGTYCDTGVCTPKKAVKEPCEADAECGSGFCPPQDKVCCDARCDTTCEACLAAKTGGADGTCAPVTVDMDPDKECTDQGAMSCKVNGTGCNGNMSTPACKVYDNTTTCAPASCTNGQASVASFCNGTGTCVAPTPTACAPYTCDSGGLLCLTKCTANNECQSTHYCDTATSVCVAKKTNGVTCVNAGQCASGNCPTADGVCCDTACNTLCRACLMNKTGNATGTCGNVTNGTDPDNECSGLTPNCNGAGACTL